MSELISGADALRALADGKDVQVMLLKIGKWVSISELSEYKINDLILNPHGDKFRLKPSTVKLEIEVPAPFEPKNGEDFFVIETGKSCGFLKGKYREDVSAYKTLIQFGAWRTEFEIKIVVEQLRKLGALK